MCLTLSKARKGFFHVSIVDSEIVQHVLSALVDGRSGVGGVKARWQPRPPIPSKQLDRVMAVHGLCKLDHRDADIVDRTIVKINFRQRGRIPGVDRGRDLAVLEAELAQRWIVHFGVLACITNLDEVRRVGYSDGILVPERVLLDVPLYMVTQRVGL